MKNYSNLKNNRSIEKLILSSFKHVTENSQKFNLFVFDRKISQVVEKIPTRKEENNKNR